MFDIRETLAVAEKVSLKIHLHTLDIQSLEQEVLAIQERISQTAAAIDLGKAELEEIYGRCEAEGLSRDRIVSVVEGLSALLIDAGAAADASHATTAPGKAVQRRTRRSKKTEEIEANVQSVNDESKNADTSASVAPDMQPAPETPKLPDSTAMPSDEQAPDVEEVVAPQVVAATPATTMIDGTPVDHGDVHSPAPAPAPIINHEQNDDDGAEEELDSSHDETFGVNVDLYRDDDAHGVDDYDMEELGDLEEMEGDFDAPADSMPSAAPVVARTVEPKESATVQQQQSPEPPAAGGFRRPSFLNRR